MGKCASKDLLRRKIWERQVRACQNLASRKTKPGKKMREPPSHKASIFAKVTTDKTVGRFRPGQEGINRLSGPNILKGLNIQKNNAFFVEVV